MLKNTASQKLTVFAFDYSTGAPKTGDAANITVYVSIDDGAVTALTDTSAAEKDATNAKGHYTVDLTQAETNGIKLDFTAKSSTANVSIVPQTIYTHPANFHLLSIDSNGRADIIKVAGTTQTAGDLASMITAVDDYVDTEVAAIKAKTDNLPADPADASDIAAAFATVNGTLATIAAYIDTEVAAIKAKTDNLPTDPADASDIAASFSTVNSTLATIAAYIDTEVAAIKAKTDNLPIDPADASDIAASFSSLASSIATLATYVDTEVAAIKAKTDNLPTDPADASDVAAAFSLLASSVSAIATDVDGLQSGIIYGAAATGTLSTTQATTNLTGYADDQLIGRAIVWLTGSCEGEATDITDYANASGLLTFTALTTAPGNGDTFKIV